MYITREYTENKILYSLLIIKNKKVVVYFQFIRNPIFKVFMFLFFDIYSSNSILFSSLRFSSFFTNIFIFHFSYIFFTFFLQFVVRMIYQKNRLFLSLYQFIFILYQLHYDCYFTKKIKRNYIDIDTE